jgi:hypothetical protein
MANIFKKLTETTPDPDFKTNLTGYYTKIHTVDAKWDVPVRIERGHVGPLDASTLFTSLSDAQFYAQGGTIQISAVGEKDTKKVYT